MAELVMKEEMKNGLDRWFGGHGGEEIGTAVYYAIGRKKALGKYMKTPKAEAARARADAKRKAKLAVLAKAEKKGPAKRMAKTKVEKHTVAKHGPRSSVKAKTPPTATSAQPSIPSTTPLGQVTKPVIRSAPTGIAAKLAKA